ncbi:bifunctional 4-hydroxy-2-oxoglutarate aldolase/2-dehydro-3-deoxy-phosphogluconate aldolase (plasmid) [Herbiconiux sp. KACC 21604]|uniref:bifunctional 4-hydroxy-2-oxoglutarate aldolase/2-dehydro-3-deoxy-phosphogluconate aldolase n=1 Tax=unclassified Herbiconiux TaxID=2618217 RepID=UPI0014927543|nr:MULTISPECIES: bifunctional 4-hydroxy-2-oxoglutarate aldolase/2-dehydro-3-deoxy-phosphogluconate aldolase [unclassified Herbiconiux]QJU56337.1 bifunctional 4-hydroxy-2-oxoglutarate aldolase/2-dehydro-3-deoxy-phosphogluconate aldolase [Herbiconiux sp. SALV-R1]WPO88844.1 bifunctional 4-hydroxy-2-oxoglutarate aldolase/2-dehydro-3-deoxy-phosphogluconate aldolase [Herbiconiux sp. KACC 21604]
MHRKLRTLNQIVEDGTIAIVRLDDADEAFRASEAAIAGGIRAIEVTLSTPGALKVIERLVEQHGSEVSIGAGTVLDAPSAYASISAGASFLVSPHLSREMIRTANRYQVPTVSGAYSPTEIVESVEEGADIVKLFPAEIGPDYVRAVLAPLAHVALMPAGGVSTQNAKTWFDAGVAAVGVGSAITKAARPDGDYSRVTAAATAFLTAVREARLT